MDAILDASVVIDIWRGYLPAVAWLQSNQALLLAAPPTTWLEVLAGTKNKVDLNRVLRLLGQFQTIHLTEADQDWAVEQFKLFHLSHDIDEIDCLTAAPAYRLQLPLYTRNLKHFTPMLGALAQQPY